MDVSFCWVWSCIPSILKFGRRAGCSVGFAFYLWNAESQVCMKICFLFSISTAMLSKLRLSVRVNRRFIIVGILNFTRLYLHARLIVSLVNIKFCRLPCLLQYPHVIPQYGEISVSTCLVTPVVGMEDCLQWRCVFFAFIYSACFSSIYMVCIKYRLRFGEVSLRHKGCEKTLLQHVIFALNLIKPGNYI